MDPEYMYGDNVLGEEEIDDMCVVSIEELQELRRTLLDQFWQQVQAGEKNDDDDKKLVSFQMAKYPEVTLTRSGSSIPRENRKVLDSGPLLIPVVPERPNMRIPPHPGYKT